MEWKLIGQGSNYDIKTALTKAEQVFYDDSLANKVLIFIKNCDLENLPLNVIWVNDIESRKSKIDIFLNDLDNNKTDLIKIQTIKPNFKIDFIFSKNDSGIIIKYFISDQYGDKNGILKDRSDLKLFSNKIKRLQFSIKELIEKINEDPLYINSDEKCKERFIKYLQVLSKFNLKFNDYKLDDYYNKKFIKFYLYSKVKKSNLEIYFRTDYEDIKYKVFRQNVLSDYNSWYISKEYSKITEAIAEC